MGKLRLGPSKSVRTDQAESSVQIIEKIIEVPIEKIVEKQIEVPIEKIIYEKLPAEIKTKYVYVDYDEDITKIDEDLTKLYFQYESINKEFIDGHNRLNTKLDQLDQMLEIQGNALIHSKDEMIESMNQNEKKVQKLEYHLKIIYCICIGLLTVLLIK